MRRRRADRIHDIASHWRASRIRMTGNTIANQSAATVRRPKAQRQQDRQY
jgi:hypothetical protein